MVQVEVRLMKNYNEVEAVLIKNLVGG